MEFGTMILTLILANILVLLLHVLFVEKQLRELRKLVNDKTDKN